MWHQGSWSLLFRQCLVAQRGEGYCHTAPGVRPDGRAAGSRFTESISLKLQGGFSLFTVYTIAYTSSCTSSWLFAHLPQMGLSIGQHFAKSGTTLRWIIWTSRSADRERVLNLITRSLTHSLGSALCRSHISETIGWIYTIWSSMEFSIDL